MFYKAADANHDGKLSKEDIEESESKFSNLEHLDSKEARIVTEIFTQTWDECIFLGRKGDLSEHEFVESYTKYFNANSEEFVKERRRCFELFFSAIDINQDQSIADDELLIVHAAFGSKQLSKDDDYFSTYQQKDGLVPLSVMVDYWVDFLTGTNESKGSVIKSGFEADGFE